MEMHPGTLIPYLVTYDNTTTLTEIFVPASVSAGHSPDRRSRSGRSKTFMGIGITRYNLEPGE
jgi:hypothetical protein